MASIITPINHSK